MSVASICKQLRRNPRDPDIVRLLKRVFELLVLYDETRDDSYIGDLTMYEVPFELMYVASKIEMNELEEFVGRTSGMAELLFQFNPCSPAAVRAQKMEYLGEEARDDPEYGQFRDEEGHEATRSFLPYITTILASCAGLRAVQIKAVGRLIHLTLDPVAWHAASLALESSMATLAAMANPKSSFRDEFQRMGGLACVGRCYLETDEPERLNVYQQVLSNVTPEEYKLNLAPPLMLSLYQLLVACCFDEETPDRENIVPEVFARMYDTAVFQNNFRSWLPLAYYRKDCPSAFLCFVSKKCDEVRDKFPHASRHDHGKLLALAFSGNEEVRKAYQWHSYPETRRRVWRTSDQASVHIAKAEEMEMHLGSEKIDWLSLVGKHNIKTDSCMLCGVQGVKLSKCGQCKVKWYCSKTCQSKDWTQHKHKEYCGK